MKINESNNFVRVFRIPYNFPSGFCFSGEIPVIFLMIDWFNPYPMYEGSITLPPLTSCPNKEIELTLEMREELNLRISNFIKKKGYSGGYDLLAITHYGNAFIIER